MLCEHCQNQDAVIHLTQVVDGNVKKLHLCEECAHEGGFDVDEALSITDVLMGLKEEDLTPSSEDHTMEKNCPSCELMFSEFKKRGRLGCPDCYETFGAELAPLVKAMHHCSRHRGKVPSRMSNAIKWSSELAELEEQLKQTVAEERFEDAASLRDRIRICREKIRCHEAG